MSTTLKVFLVIILLLFSYLVIHKINKQSISMRYSCIWLVMIMFLMIIAIFPEHIIKIAQVLGFEKSSNMIFLIAIAVLFYITFLLTITVSKQNDKIKDLIQEISILKKNNKEKRNNDEFNN